MEKRGRGREKINMLAQLASSPHYSPKQREKKLPIDTRSKIMTGRTQGALEWPAPEGISDRCGSGEGEGAEDERLGGGRGGDEGRRDEGGGGGILATVLQVI